MESDIKYRIINKIMKCNDPDVLYKVKLLLDTNDNSDFWDDLNEEDKTAIQEGIQQLNAGQTSSHEEVRNAIKDRFQF